MEMEKSRQFEFTIIASGLDHEADDFEDRFFTAGCDDATIAFARGRIMLHFARDASNLAEAVNSALEDVRSAGASVERVEPDYLVSLTEIAERANLSKSAVSLYVKGERGADFPVPVARMTTTSPLWNWTEVADWLFKRRQISGEEAAKAHILREANARIENQPRRELLKA